MSLNYNEILLNAGIRFVSYRPRSEKETRDFLLKKNQKLKIVDTSIIRQVIERLRELGYVDDRKFVTWWLEQRRLYRPKGKRLLSAELRSKGIDKDALGDLILPQEEKKLAKTAAEKAVKKLARYSKLEQRKKLYAHLLRRGFSFETVGNTVDSVVGKAYNSREVE